MSAAISTNLKVYNAERFKASLESNTEPFVYLTIGRTSPWEDDNAPEEANTAVVNFYTVWRNMTSAKKIVGSDVRLATRRYDWAAGQTYAAYDDCSCPMHDLDSRYFVVTDEWNVYKCIANNNGGLSNTKPTSLLTDNTIETADKYVWKYMYTLSDEERLRFMTDDYIPVRTLKEDNGSLQWQVQQDAVDGGIYAIKVLDGGTGYANANTISISISGDGSGANAVARVSASNTLDSIVMTNPGSGYTYATVSVTDTGGGSNAEVRAIMSPPGGHGFDPARELVGSNVIINVRIRGSEQGILSTENDFRQVALIENIRLKSNNQIASNVVYTQTMTVVVDSGVTDFVEDEFVFQGTSLLNSTFSGRVVSWDNANNQLKLINVEGTPSVDPLFGETSAASRFVQSFTDRSLKPFSGNLLYIDNITPIQRADDQTEDFKIVVKF